MHEILYPELAYRRVESLEKMHPSLLEISTKV